MQLAELLALDAGMQIRIERICIMVEGGLSEREAWNQTEQQPELGL